MADSAFYTLAAFVFPAQTGQPHFFAPVLE